MNGCYQDVIDLDLSEIERSIVIEGTITDELKSHVVKINQTSDYSDPYNFPPVTGAKVSVYDSEQEVVSFVETERGIYESPVFSGVPGRTYSLEVVVGNQTYTAASFLPEPMEIISAVFIPRNNNTDYDFKYSFEDDENKTEYCRFNIFVNDIQNEELSFLYNGRYFNGEVTEKEYSGAGLFTDQIYIKVYTFDEVVFDILSEIDDKAELNNGDSDIDAETIFDLSSFNVSNISNGAIGLFSVQSVRKYTYRYQAGAGLNQP